MVRNPCKNMRKPWRHLWKHLEKHAKTSGKIHRKTLENHGKNIENHRQTFWKAGKDRGQSRGPILRGGYSDKSGVSSRDPLPLPERKLAKARETAASFASFRDFLALFSEYLGITGFCICSNPFATCSRATCGLQRWWVWHAGVGWGPRNVQLRGGPAQPPDSP